MTNSAIQLTVAILSKQRMMIPLLLLQLSFHGVDRILQFQIGGVHERPPAR